MLNIELQIRKGKKKDTSLNEVPLIYTIHRVREL